MQNIWQRICVASYYTDNYQYIADIVVPEYQKYCSKHNYDCIVENITSQKFDRHPVWYKIPLIQKLLNDYDVILYIDVDAVITRLDIKLESLIEDDKYLYIAKDFNGINAGVMLLKSSNWLKTFFDQVWTIDVHNPIYAQHGIAPQDVWHCTLTEQLAIISLLEKYRDKYVKWMPQKLLNAYVHSNYNVTNPEGEWDSSSFILHTPSTYPEQRVNILKNCLNIHK